MGRGTGEARHLGLLKGLELRRIASYPLGGDDDAEGVILQISQAGRDLSRFT